MENSYNAVINNINVKFRYKGDVKVPFKRVTSVSVIPFTKNGEIVAVRLKNRGLDIPGGHVEKDEKLPEETLVREVMEEAQITITDPILIETIETDYFGSEEEKLSYMLIYTAFVDKFLKYSKTNDNAYERVVLSKKNFINEYSAGNKILMEKTINKAEKILFNK